jgi:hypothetical protein
MALQVLERINAAIIKRIPDEEALPPPIKAEISGSGFFGFKEAQVPPPSTPIRLPDAVSVDYGSASLSRHTSKYKEGRRWSTQQS